MGSLRTGVLIGGSIVIAGKALSASANLLVNLVIARVASIEEIGSFFLLQSMLIFAVALASLGVPQYLLQTAARDAAENRQLDHTLVAGCVGAVVLTSAIGAAVYVVGEFGFGWTRSLFGFGLEAWMPLTALSIFALNAVFAELDRAQGKIAKAVFLGGGLQPVIFIAGILVMVAHAKDVRAGTLFAAYVLAACAPIVAQVAGYAKAFTADLRARPIVNIWRSSLPFWGSSMLLTLATQAQLWIIAKWGGVGDVGLFGAVFKLSLILSAMNMVFGGFMPPLVSRMYFSGQREQAEKVLRAYSTFSSVVVVGFCLVAALSGETILVLLLGQQYASGADILLLVCVLHLVNQLCGHRGVVFLMLGHERLLFRITIVSATAGMLGGALVMSKFGLHWYVCSVVAFGSITALVEAYFARRTVGIRPYADWRLLNPARWVGMRVGSQAA